MLRYCVRSQISAGHTQTSSAVRELAAILWCKKREKETIRGLPYIDLVTTVVLLSWSKRIKKYSTCIKPIYKQKKGSNGMLCDVFVCYWESANYQLDHCLDREDSVVNCCLRYCKASVKCHLLEIGSRLHSHAEHTVLCLYASHGCTYQKAFKPVSQTTE